MSTINEGWPAFPAPEASQAHFGSPDVYMGMTLRDYFAAKALQGMLADLPKSCYGLNWSTLVAEQAYALADSMLKARGVQP